MARAKPRRRVAGTLADHGTPERGRHGELVARATGIPGVTGKQVKHECRLDWYLDKASIVDRQHAAGIRFRRDWQLAVARPVLVGRYAPRVAGARDFTETQLAARRRVKRAVVLLGDDLARVVVDVCCVDNWAAERLPRLREGLSLLADHYGLDRA